MKLSAEDYMDEHAGELENMQGGVRWDQSYKPKQDRGDLDLFWLDIWKKKYPGKKDVPQYYEDDVGLSTVSSAKKIKNNILIQCHKCQSVYLEELNGKNLRIADIPEPNMNDVYHQDNDRNFGATSPIGYINESHEDNKKIISTPATQETDRKKVRRLRPYVKSKESIR